MSNHNVGESPFMKRVLVPFWVIRILVMAIDIVVYGLGIGVLAVYSRNDRTTVKSSVTSNTAATMAIFVVILLVILVCLILDIVCIVKRARRSLTPKSFLIINCVQTTIWLILFILAMIGNKTVLSIAINVIVLLSFVGVLIYASVIYHRAKKGTLTRGNYAAAHNPVAPGVQNTAYPGGGMYPQYEQYGGQQQGGAYPPQSPAAYQYSGGYASPQQQQPYVQSPDQKAYYQTTTQQQQHYQPPQQGHDVHELQTRYT